MDKVYHELAELVGDVLAQRWLRLQRNADHQPASTAPTPPADKENERSEHSGSTADCADQPVDG